MENEIRVRGDIGYQKGWPVTKYVVQINGEYLVAANGLLRKFGTKEAARKAAEKSIKGL